MISKTVCSLILISSVCFFVAMESCNGKSPDVDIDIISTMVSPNKEYVATNYYISGGGAAGYVYRLVNLRRQQEKFDPKKGIVFQVTHTENITVTWEDNAHMTIKYSKPSSLLTQVKEWGTGERKIQIHYVEA